MTKLPKTNYWNGCVSPVECLADFTLAVLVTLGITLWIASLIQ